MELKKVNEEEFLQRLCNKFLKAKRLNENIKRCRCGMKVMEAPLMTFLFAF